MRNISHYNKNLKPLARNLRNNSTKGEIILWKEVLRERKMKGYQFNRQFPINNYIADFICRRLNLIIEVDGYSHIFKPEQDAKRDKDLESIGYFTLRIQDKEIHSNLSNVILTIENTVDMLESKLNNPPSPL